jgi:hypothetical protein
MLSLSQIEALAPDQAALAAASKLLKPAGWPLLARDAATTVVWGEAQGSGSAPYRLMFDPADRSHKCSCPSRKFPCKHVLALMWQLMEHPERFTIGEPAPWVNEWLARRRPGPGRPAEERAPGATSIAGIVAPEPEDPAAQALAARRRARSEAAREAAVAAGLEAADVWLADQLGAGLAGFPQRASAACRAAAQRLVDAKAGTLAARLDALPSALLGRPESLRADFVITELGRLHLMSAAWRRRDRLDARLAQDLRRGVGWSVNRDDLLADAEAPRRSGDWIVAGVRHVVQPDRLRRTETWIVAAEDADQPLGRGLLLDFAPVQTGAAGDGLPAGERFSGELVFYPSAEPLRAIIAARAPAAAFAQSPSNGPPLAAAFAAHQARLAALPWLGDDMIFAGGCQVVEAAGALHLWDPSDGLALPLAIERTRAAAPLVGLTLNGLAGVWDGQLLTLLAASTPAGPWFADL